MIKSDDRMDLISSAIKNQAQQQAKDIIARANKYRQDQLSDYTEKVIDSMYDVIQRAVNDSRNKMLSAISTAERDAYNQLLSRRNQLCNNVFEKAAQNLKKFAESFEYKTNILSEMKDIAEDFDNTYTIISLAPKDISLSTEIEKIIPQCKIVEDKSIQIGGFILENTLKRRRFEQTLDYCLAAQRPWFLQHCNLQVQ